MTTETDIATTPEQKEIAAPLRRFLTAEDLHARVQLVQQVMARIMRPGEHYGTIPGTDKPTLYKSGSEVLLTTFRIAVAPAEIDLSTDDCVRYRVHCKGIHSPSGEIIGTGIGECSSDEDKYRWRAQVCDAEYDATPADRRREVWKRGQRSTTYLARQIRTNPADLANTVLKMAKKRAQIDLTLTATAASDCFAQDLEDLPAELRDTVIDQPAPARGPPPHGARGAPPAADVPEIPEQTPAAVERAILDAQSFDALNLLQLAAVRDEKERARLRKLRGERAEELRGDSP